MPKSNSNSLINLVKKLTPGEIRYVKNYSKVYSERHNTRYILLLKLIYTDKIENEDTLKKELKIETQKELSELKKYLFDTILKALRLKNERFSERASVQNQISEGQLLLERGLKKEGIKRLENAYMKARKLEFLDCMINIQVKLHGQVNFIPEYEAKDDILKLIEQYKCFIHEENNTYNLVKDYLKDGRSDTPPPSRKKFQSTPEEVAYYEGKYFLAVNTKASVEKVLDATGHLFALYENNPDYFLARPSMALAILNNYCNALIDSEQYEQSEYALQRLENFAKKQRVKYNRVRALGLCHAIRIRLLSSKDQMDYGAFDDFNVFYREHRSLLPSGLGLITRLNVIIYLFANEKYDRCSDWTSLTLSDNTSHFPLVILSIKLINLLCHFQLGNMQLFEHLIRSLRREFHKNKTHQQICLSIEKLAKKSLDPKGKRALIKQLNASKKIYYGKDEIVGHIKSLQPLDGVLSGE